MRLNEIGIERPTKRSPDLEFEDKPKKKTEPDIIDSVIVYLKGKQSEKYTKWANTFRQLREAEQDIKTKKDALNAKLKDSVDALFPETDDVYTRVVDTASLILKVGKAEEAHEIEKFDAVKYIEEISALFPELKDTFSMVREKYTTIHEIAAKSPKLLTPKLKEPKKEKTESVIEEGFGDRISQYTKTITNKVMRLLKRWDLKYQNISSRIDLELA